MVFIFHFVDMAYHIHRFVDIEESLHPCDKSPLIIVYDPINVLLNLIGSVTSRIATCRMWVVLVGQ